MVRCAGYHADLAAVLLTADLESSRSPILVWPAAIAEISLILWLLARAPARLPFTCERREPG